MNFDNFIIKFKEELAIEEAVSANDVLKESSWWDSMSALDVIALADRDYNITITFEEFRSAVTVSDIYNLLHNKK